MLALTQFGGTTFRCENNICVGTDDATYQIYRALQQRLNALAPVAPFAPISVDGKLGNDTVNATKLAALYLVSMGFDNATIANIAANGTTAALLAIGAVDITNALTAGAARYVKVPSVATALPAATSPAPKPSRAKYIWAGAAGFSLVVVIGLVARRERRA